MAIVYKFVELSVVTDETIEENVNRWVGEGWAFSSLHFAMSDSSRRPTMAFLSFVRDTGDDASTKSGNEGRGS
jgi:hypothetical protein